MIKAECGKNGVDVKTEGTGLVVMSELTAAVHSVVESLSEATGDSIEFTTLWVLSQIQGVMLARIEKEKNRP